MYECWERLVRSTWSSLFRLGGVVADLFRRDLFSVMFDGEGGDEPSRKRAAKSAMPPPASSSTDQGSHFATEISLASYSQGYASMWESAYRSAIAATSHLYRMGPCRL